MYSIIKALLLLLIVGFYCVGDKHALKRMQCSNDWSNNCKAKGAWKPRENEF